MLQHAPAGRWALFVVIAAACLHAASHALMRPAFQISDEAAYFAGAQHQALADLAAEPSTSTTCVAAPDGQPLLATAVGKPAFRHVGGWLLGWHCRNGDASAAVPLLRLVIGLTVPLTTLFASLLARELVPASRGVALASATLVGQHSVLASYGAAVTPDAFANSLAACSLWLLVRFSLGRSHWFEAGLLVAAAGAAAAMKDSALFLLPCLLVACLLRLGRSHAPDDWPRSRLLDPQILLVAGTLASGAILAMRTPAILSPYFQLLPPPGQFPVRAVVEGTMGAAVESLPAQVWSAWSNVGNFGGHDPQPPVALTMVQVVMVAMGVPLGACRLVRGASLTSHARGNVGVVVMFGMATALLVLQPVVKNVLLDADDHLQGRWLFPMATGAAALTAIGWAWSGPRGAWIPAVTTTAYAWAYLLLTLVPAYYETLASTYRWSSLYLLGPYGASIPPERIRLYVERPDWASGPMIWVVATAWILTSGIAVVVGLLTTRPPVAHTTLPHPPPRCQSPRGRC